MSFAQAAAQVSNVPTAATMPFLAEIARDNDFRDKLTYSTPGELVTLKLKLEQANRRFGEIRSAVSDLCRSRLTEVRRHLAV